MKRVPIILILLLAAVAIITAQEQTFSIGGCTDAYIIAGKESSTLTAGQDVNIGAGPFYFDLAADWTKPLWKGDQTLDFDYTVGFSRAFGVFTPALEVTGDQSFTLVRGAEPSGDWFSDLEPSLNVALGKIGLDLYSDLSFEEDYELLQTADLSAYANLGPAAFRVGFLYMDAQAVEDDVGYPNAPDCLEGNSFYATASVEY